MKRFFLVVVLALTTLSISAQDKVFLEYDIYNHVEKTYRDRNFAIKLGAGVADLSGANSYYALSYKLAFSYDCRLWRGLYFIPEMDFVVKGSYPAEWENRLDLAYLQVPLCLAWKFELPKNMKLGIKAGPYAAVGLFGSTIKWDGGDESDVFNSNYGTNRFDAGVMLGVHFDFFAFTLGVEYSRGFIMVNDDYRPFDGYNQAVGATFGVRF